MENKQHVQLPNDMTESLTPQDLLIYLTIKRYMNNETKEAFPSQQLICEKSGASINTVRKSIERLKEQRYIETYKKGRQIFYRFLKWDRFEPFSYEFLDKSDLTFTEKAYLIASQQYMFKDIEPYGKITLSNEELAKRINMSERTIYRCDKSLEQKNYLNIIKTNKKDLETGLSIREKLYHLTEVEQEIVFILKNHENRITNTENEIEQLKKQVAYLLRENSELKRKESYNYVIE